MEAVCLKLVNLSISASWLVLAILVLRLVFRKAPKWIVCLLWGLVGLRLVCPVSIESALSLIPSAQTLPPEILYTATPQIDRGIQAINSVVNPVLGQSMAPAQGASANPTQIWSLILAWVWAVGMVVMALYALVSYWLVKRRVATATLLRENIKQSERVSTPFVLGIVRPVIYLPYHLAEEDLAYYDVTNEERSYAHIFSGGNTIHMTGRCMYCNHCQPCPAHIDIAAVTKFLDLATQQDTVPETVAQHYWALSATADDCLMCGRCEPNCPFGVKIRENMKKAREIFQRK